MLSPAIRALVEKLKELAPGNYFIDRNNGVVGRVSSGWNKDIENILKSSKPVTYVTNYFIHNPRYLYIPYNDMVFTAGQLVNKRDIRFLALTISRNITVISEQEALDYLKKRKEAKLQKRKEKKMKLNDYLNASKKNLKKLLSSDYFIFIDKYYKAHSIRCYASRNHSADQAVLYVYQLDKYLKPISRIFPIHINNFTSFAYKLINIRNAN